LQIEKSDSQTDGPEIVLKNLYQASSGTDELGSITFGGWRDVSDTGSYISAIGGYDVAYPGTSGQLRFFTSANGDTDPSAVRGDSQERMRITVDEVVVNETSNNHDFRVETNSINDAFVIDADQDVIKFKTNVWQHAPLTGSFAGGWVTVTNLDTISNLTSNSGAKIRVYANENGRTNVSYSEHLAVRTNGTWALLQLGEVTSGNSHGNANLQMSGTNLQIRNAASSSIGSWKVSLELFR
jgi:hypothetical protein